MLRVLILCLAVAAPVRAAATDPMRDAAFEGAQWIMFTAAAQAVAGVGARLAAGDDDLGRAIRARQEAEGTVSALRAAVLDTARAGGDTAAEEAALRAGEAALAALEGDIAARFPAYAEFAVPRPLSVAEVQRLLRPGEALVLIVTGATGTYVWAVAPSAAAWTRADWGDEALGAAVTRLRADLDPTAPARAAVRLTAPAPRGPGFDRALAHRLYADLMAPLAPVLEAAAVVQVVAQGPLASLPLALLVTDPPEGDDADPAALAATGWLIRRHALVTLPAVSSLGSLRQAGAGRAGAGRFVGVGAPLLDGPAGGDTVIAARGAPIATGSMGDPAAIRRLPALPGTARELRAVARLFAPEDRTILTGAQATEAALRSLDLGAARILHVATHGLVTGELQGLTEPALVLTPPEVASPEDDGLLTASEAARLPLDADWVVLSACNTAAGDSLGGESLSGLARAFFFAGARALLVSHWPVRDDAAASLVADTIGRVQDGAGRAEGLRAATLALMARPGFGHPSAWAPFVVVGEGGPLQ
jgi:CHAT domain-containing protein